MIKTSSLKSMPGKPVALSSLSFEQKIYSKNETVKETHSELVNALYDMQNWHLFQKKELSFDEKVEKFTTWFGEPASKKKIRDKGDTYLWIIEVNDSLYTLYLCSYAFFMEKNIKTPFEKAWSDVQEIEAVLFSDAKQKPHGMRTRK